MQFQCTMHSVRLDRRLEEVAKAVGGGHCRLQMPLKLALGVRETVPGHGPGALEGGGGGLPPFQCTPAPHLIKRKLQWGGGGGLRMTGVLAPRAPARASLYGGRLFGRARPTRPPGLPAGGRCTDGEAPARVPYAPPPLPRGWSEELGGQRPLPPPPLMKGSMTQILHQRDGGGGGVHSAAQTVARYARYAARDARDVRCGGGV